MGCDIHFHIEHKKNGKWTKVINPKADESLEYPDYEPSWGLDRDYEMFALLAGVRGELRYDDDDEPYQIGFPWYAFPDDLSDEVKADLSDEGHYHSHTCITLPEFLAFDWDMPWKGEVDRRKQTRCKECKSLYYVVDKSIYTFAHRFDDLMKVIEKMKGLDDNPENVRAVFAFDS